MSVMRRLGGVVGASLLGSLLLAGLAQASTFTVNTAASSGPGSLASAITQANASAAADTITFAIGAPGTPHLISLATGLPTVTRPITIDGRSQGGPGYTGPPLIQLVGCPTAAACLPGTSTGANGPGVRLASTAAGSTVSGLSVVRFNHGGIIVEAPQSVISGNYLGVDLSGVGPGVGNGEGGVQVKASGVTVGGTTAAAANVIGDNHVRCGVDVMSGTGSVVRGNLIGTDRTGVSGLGNASLPAGELPSCGVRVEGTAAQTTIGGSGGARNVISGNDRNGVEILGGTSTVLQGNLIGLGSDQATVVANAMSGVLVAGGTGTIVGGPSPAARNIISGNFNGAGVRVIGGSVLVEGNFIGVGPDGATSLSNHDGVLVTGGSPTIGGTGSGTGNLISGNAATGLTVGSGSSGAVVIGNQVGGGADGAPAVGGNGGAQIRVTGTAKGARIGTLPSGGNRVIDVSGTGPIVLDGGGLDNAVRGNTVRLNSAIFRTAIDRGPAGISASSPPKITSVFTSGSRTQVNGTLTGAANTTYAVDVYADSACSSTAHRGIDRYLGSGIATTDASGRATMSAAVSGTPTGGERLLVAATSAAGTGELGPCSDAAQAAPTLQLSAASYSAKESAGVVKVTVTRTGGGPGSAGVHVRTADGTAIAGKNYTATDFNAVINADQASTTVNIPIKDDLLRAGDRTFTVDLSQPNTAVLGSRSHAVVTVVDDTPKSRLHVRITRPFGSVLYTEFTSIRGRATGAGVRRIEVAVTRTAHCDRLGSDRRLHRAADPKTCAPKWLRAKGTSAWKLILPHRLRVGVYKVRVRGIDRKGLTTSVVSRTVSVH